MAINRPLTQQEQVWEDMEKIRDIAQAVPLPVILAFMHKRFMDTERWDEAEAVQVALEKLEQMKLEERIKKETAGRPYPVETQPPQTTH